MCSATTYADNVALPAHSHAALLCAVQQSIDIFCRAGPQQQSLIAAVGQTDGQTPDRCIDPAPHTISLQVVPINIKQYI